MKKMDASISALISAILIILILPQSTSHAVTKKSNLDIVQNPRRYHVLIHQLHQERKRQRQRDREFGMAQFFFQFDGITRR